MTQRPTPSALITALAPLLEAHGGTIDVTPINGQSSTIVLHVASLAFHGTLGRFGDYEHEEAEVLEATLPGDVPLLLAIHAGTGLRLADPLATLLGRTPVQDDPQLLTHLEHLASQQDLDLKVHGLLGLTYRGRVRRGVSTISVLDASVRGARVTLDLHTEFQHDQIDLTLFKGDEELLSLIGHWCGAADWNWVRAVLDRSWAG